MVLHVERAHVAVARLAHALRVDVERAADGVVRVVNAGMERAIRRISIERGHDPRAYTLVAFGGAAGMHACALAAGLGMRRVLVPMHPGMLSAWGAVTADLRRDHVQTVRLVDPDPRALTRRLRALAARARRELRAEGATRIRISAVLDVRYCGQSYELQVPITAHYGADFHAAHRARYGYADAARALEVVNLRIITTAPSTLRPRISSPATIFADVDMSTTGFRAHRLHWNGRWLRAHCCDRGALPIGRPLDGPVVVTEVSATTVVPPGWAARVAPSGDLLLESKR
jgi:N-methylhydantoinase A